MERLESLRLETDSRRRTVSALAEDYERKKARPPCLPRPRGR